MRRPRRNIRAFAGNLLAMAAMNWIAMAATPAFAQEFVNGLAQPVFAGQPTLTHNVWVEIANLDSDRDGVNDRIRIQVRRPQATETGTRLPVVMIASPYSRGSPPSRTTYGSRSRISIPTAMA